MSLSDIQEFRTVLSEKNSFSCSDFLLCFRAAEPIDSSFFAVVLEFDGQPVVSSPPPAHRILLSRARKDKLHTSVWVKQCRMG